MLQGHGEFQIIDFLRRQGRSAPGLVKGIGDDCAVAELAADECLLTTADLLTESVHFDLGWSDLHQLGRKSVSVNVSDLAAMGATPRFLFLSLALPATLGTGDIDRFLGGVLQACDDYGIVLAGGDTCRSQTGLTIAVTAQGTAPRGKALFRSGARPGDAIFVTGTVGDSGLALRQLQEGIAPEQELLQRHLDPTARIGTGLALAAAEIPTAMIDISDGLLGDLEHILDDSNCGAMVEMARVPLSQPFRRSLEQNPEVIDLALGGGEDYELLFTASPTKEATLVQIATQTGVPITRLGEVTAENGKLTVLSADGAIYQPARRGYQHFPETGE